MQRLRFLLALLLPIAGFWPGEAYSQKAFCPRNVEPLVVEIREADPAIDFDQHKRMRKILIDCVQRANTTIRLGPTVVMDFQDAHKDLPLKFAPCVTLTSVASFGPPTPLPGDKCEFRPDILLRAERGSRPVPAPPVVLTQPPAPRTRPHLGEVIDVTDLQGEPTPPQDEQARSPHSLGPLLKFGKHQGDDKAFLEVGCPAGDDTPSDGVRISGFRLYGPSFGPQEVDDTGILIWRCLDVEISNMEIAGWGGAGIEVQDEVGNNEVLGSGPGQQPPNNVAGERIGRSIPVKIFDNFIHHNQHPSHHVEEEGIEGLLLKFHANGYGVVVSEGGWAQIFQNVFDFNRHAIAASWHSGGYDADRNLVLKGGGYHFAGFYTHQFDIHGRGPGGKGLDAGTRFSYSQNAFQYIRDNAIHIRGRPLEKVTITHNIFPHEGLENDRGDDAIAVHYRNDIYEYNKIVLGPGNVVNFDSYGQYGVCDFDGDLIDDLFLATGVTWWFSSMGEFPWTFLSARNERLNEVRFGYFDKDSRCDVLTESGGQWMISSGGRGLPYSIGSFGSLSDVRFGRFDLSQRDHRAGVNKRTTHAFRRTTGGQWEITPLSEPKWHVVGGSSFPMSALQFGDFTGDGVTDVLAIEGGRWAISAGAQGNWHNHNPYLSDNLSTVLIADLDNNNFEDVIKLDTKVRGTPGHEIVTYTWKVSDDGLSKWRPLREYSFTLKELQAGARIAALAGRFGVAPGAGVLLVDPTRTGRFYSEAEHPNENWTSLFAY
jgi:hypothetical protein